MKKFLGIIFFVTIQVNWKYCGKAIPFRVG